MNWENKEIFRTYNITSSVPFTEVMSSRRRSQTKFVPNTNSLWTKSFFRIHSQLVFLHAVDCALFPINYRPCDRPLWETLTCHRWFTWSHFSRLLLAPCPNCWSHSCTDLNLYVEQRGQGCRVWTLSLVMDEYCPGKTPSPPPILMV